MSGDERWNVKAASYAWVVGGVQGGNQDKHEYGGMGGMGRMGKWERKMGVGDQVIFLVVIGFS